MEDYARQSYKYQMDVSLFDYIFRLSEGESYQYSDTVKIYTTTLKQHLKNDTS